MHGKPSPRPACSILVAIALVSASTSACQVIGGIGDIELSSDAGALQDATKVAMDTGVRTDGSHPGTGDGSGSSRHATSSSSAATSSASSSATSAASSSGSGGGADASADATTHDSGTGCVIGGMDYASGETNPADKCQICQPATSTSAWSSLADGPGCGTGEVCHAGACVSGCFVGGTFRAPGAASPASACRTCQPSASTTTWTDLATGTTCGAGEVCNGGACASGCFIGGAVYAAAAAEPGNSCASCQPATSTTTWSPLAAGTACGTGAFCNAGACVTGCLIGGAVYASAAAEPGNVCETCQPATSTTAWTPATNGTPCPTSPELCIEGVCECVCCTGCP